MSQVPQLTTADMPEELRQAQCPARLRNHTCIDLNMRLGWSHLLELDKCDVCWSLGGLDSKEGQQWRESKSQQVVAQYSAPEMRLKLKRDVLVPLTIKHKVFPLGDLKADEELAKAVNRDSSWAKAKPSWEEAEAWLTAAAEFGKSLLSRGLLSKRVDDTVRQLRNISCFGKGLDGTVYKPPCPWLAKSHDGKHHFCAACGCGDKQIAHLDKTHDDSPSQYTKLDYPHLACPRGMSGFSNAKG